jgi:serine acetyltransferase
MFLRRAVSSLLRRTLAGILHRTWDWVLRTGMVTADTASGRRFRRFGPGSSMAFPTGTVFGHDWIEIGSDTVVGQHVTLSAGLVPGLDLGPDAVIRIGDRCAIGRGSHVVGHLSVEIGDDVYTGPYVYITDQNHSYDDPDQPIGRQWPRNEPVRIGSGSWLGAGAVVLPGARIGANVVVAAGSVVRGEFPDHCVIAGVPARIVRRHVPGLGWEPPLRGVPPLSADDLLTGEPQAG